MGPVPTKVIGVKSLVASYGVGCNKPRIKSSDPEPINNETGPATPQ